MKLKRMFFITLPPAMIILKTIFISCHVDDILPNSYTTDDPVVNNYLLVATGQSTLYDKDGEVINNLIEGDILYGQDANYLNGEEMRYQDNGDGTITDNVTGLMWTQTDNGEGLDWEHALSYAENFKMGGYSEWRLPNVKELQGIVDYSYAPGAIDASKDRAAIDPLFSCTPIINEAGNDDYGYYWTSTSACFSSDEPYYYAWYVAFGRAVNGAGEDYHGAGAVRFDTKYEGGLLAAGDERFYNLVRLVRNIN